MAIDVARKQTEILTLPEIAIVNRGVSRREDAKNGQDCDVERRQSAGPVVMADESTTANRSERRRS